jgi:hypothetical protein
MRASVRTSPALQDVGAVLTALRASPLPVSGSSATLTVSSATVRLCAPARKLAS